jgi:hypothetical protein
MRRHGLERQSESVVGLRLGVRLVGSVVVAPSWSAHRSVLLYRLNTVSQSA